MNTFRCLSLTGYNAFRSIFDQHSIQTTVNDKISAASTSAISSLKCISEKIYNQLIGRIKTHLSSITATRATPDEKALWRICCDVVLRNPSEEEKKKLIQEAKDLIKKGVNIHPYLFDGMTFSLKWLHENCLEELFERAAVSKKGLELINFDDVPPTKAERKLYEICIYREENEEISIQQAKDLIKTGVNIHPGLFKDVPLTLKWLHENCLEELFERAAVSKKGLDLINFDDVPPTKAERKLFEICIYREENEEISIQQAKDLIKAGTCLHPSLFKDIPSAISWLRTHCTEELFERAANKKGLDLIDFETMLPLDWQPPKWLPPFEKLEMPKGMENNPNQPTIPLSTYRRKCRQLAKNINQSLLIKPLVSAGGLLLGDVVSTGLIRSLLSENRDITISISAISAVATAILLPVMISYACLKIGKAPLNLNDMQRLHSKALQNPLYASLWKKVETPISLEFVPRSVSSCAHYNSGINKINIYKEVSERRAFEALIFESANASQKNSFKKIFKKANQGKLDREEYVRLKEFVEWNSLNLYHQIVNFGNEHLGWQKTKWVEKYYTSLIKNWENANIRDLKTKKSHADSYRNVWEDFFGFLYWIRHPEKAPSDLDWINRISKSDSTSPLKRLVWDPGSALLWKIDPFMQFIDKGAKVDDDLVSCLLLEAISDTQYTDVNAARIRKLLELGVSLPKDLGPKEKAWLETNVKQDLRE